MEQKLHIAVIYGSVRSQRQGIKATKFIAKQIENRGHEVKLIDPLEYNIPLLFKRYMDYEEGKAPENLQKLHKIFTKADAYVIVSGEYNHTIPPALVNMLNHFFDEYKNKPSGIVSYSGGPFAGYAVTIQLRTFLAKLNMSSIPTTFPISTVQDSFDEEGNDITEKKDYERRIEKFLEEFEWYTYALKNHREKVN